MKQEIIIGFNEKDQRLDKFLRKVFKDVELSLIFKDIRKGNIKVNGKKSSVDYKLKENDVLRIFGYHYDLKGKNQEKYEIDKNYNYLKPKICFEDSNILVVIKDIDTLVHSNGDEEVIDLTKNVRTYLSKKGDYVPEKNLTFSPSPVNRLDRNTYGLVMFGKNNTSLNELNSVIRERKVSKYYRALVEGKIKNGVYKAYIKKDHIMFGKNNTSLNELNSVIRERKVSKYYRALVEGKIKNGVYKAYIKKDHRLNKSLVSNKKDDESKEIQMEINMLDTNGVVSLVEIKLITGRSHQIRSHFKFLGNPIIGDLKYGNKELRNYFFNKYGVENQLLFAYKLVFNGIDENMSINYLNNKVIVMPFPSRFKRIMKQEFKITV